MTKENEQAKDAKSSYNDVEQQKEAESSDILVDIKNEVIESVKGGVALESGLIRQAGADLRSLKSRLKREPDPDPTYDVACNTNVAYCK